MTTKVTTVPASSAATPAPSAIQNPAASTVRVMVSTSSAPSAATVSKATGVKQDSAWFVVCKSCKAAGSAQNKSSCTVVPVGAGGKQVEQIHMREAKLRYECSTCKSESIVLQAKHAEPIDLHSYACNRGSSSKSKEPLDLSQGSYDDLFRLRPGRCYGCDPYGGETVFSQTARPMIVCGERKCRVQARLLSSVVSQSGGYCVGCMETTADRAMFVRFLCGHTIHALDCFPGLLTSAINSKRLMYVPAPHDMFTIGCPLCTATSGSSKFSAGLPDRVAMCLAGHAIYEKYQAYATEMRQFKAGDALYCPCCTNLLELPQVVLQALRPTPLPSSSSCTSAPNSTRTDGPKDGCSSTTCAPVCCSSTTTHMGKRAPVADAPRTQVLVACPYPTCGKAFCARCQFSKAECTCLPGVSIGVPSGGSKTDAKTDSTAVLVARAKALESSMDLIAKTTRACPHCGTRATHYLGQMCHHISPGTGCLGTNKDGTPCRKHWCYYCGEDWDPKLAFDSRHAAHMYCSNVPGGCKVCPVCPICNQDHITHDECPTSRVNPR